MITRYLKAVATMAAVVLVAGTQAISAPDAGPDPSQSSMATADAHSNDDHSRNVRLLRNRPIRITKTKLAQGSDLAFQGNLLVAGTFEGTAFYRILKRRPYVRQIGFHDCPGSQGDISIWGRYVVVSVDAPATNIGKSNICNNTDNSERKEGIRIIDISDMRQPRQVKFVETQCGSHTHVLLPKDNNLFVYVNSYPIVQEPACNQANHQIFSIIKFPQRRPRLAKVIGTHPVPQPSIGCHDTTVYPARNLAVAACLQNTLVLNISKPGVPKTLATITNPEINFHHSSSFTWDGRYVIVSDEYNGAAGPGGCVGDKDSMIGAMWFYDIGKNGTPSNPIEAGHYSLPRVPPTDPDPQRTFRCTTHLYNILPMRNPRRYVAAASYYQGGLSVVDFSDPAAPKELGHYMPVRADGTTADSWAAYWYNGRIYSNDHKSKHGIRVFRMWNTGERKVRFFRTRFNPQVQLRQFQRRR